jgi:hypothetical protein
MKNAIRLSARRFTRLSTLRFIAFAVVGASIFPATAQSTFDVVGVRPGMTEAEAMSALTAHRPGMRVQKRNMSYNFRDGVQQINTESFLHEVWVTYDDAQGQKRELESATHSGPTHCAIDTKVRHTHSDREELRGPQSDLGRIRETHVLALKPQSNGYW